MNEEETRQQIILQQLMVLKNMDFDKYIGVCREFENITYSPNLKTKPVQNASCNHPWQNAKLDCKSCNPNGVTK